MHFKTAAAVNTCDTVTASMGNDFPHSFLAHSHAKSCHVQLPTDGMNMQRLCWTETGTPNHTEGGQRKLIQHSSRFYLNPSIFNPISDTYIEKHAMKLVWRQHLRYQYHRSLKILVISSDKRHTDSFWKRHEKDQRIN